MVEQVTASSSKSKERDLNFELLRIVLMMMIVAQHVINNGILDTEGAGAYPNSIWAGSLGTFFEVAVNSFVLITGYYGSRFRWNKVIKLLLEMLFYSLGIYVVFCALGLESFSLVGLVRYCIPVQWWFLDYYLILLFLAPYLNLLIQHMTAKQHGALVVFLLFLWSFCSQFLNYNFGGGISNFVLLYLLGRYVHLYRKPQGKWYRYGIGYLLFCVLAAILDAALYWAAATPYTWKIRFFASDGLVMIGASLCFFLMFCTLSIKARWIPHVSACMLGVYMIHEHPLIRTFYLGVFKVKDFIEQPFSLWLKNFAVTTVAVFLLCLSVEFLRRTLLEQGFEKVSRAISECKLLNWIQSRWKGTFWTFGE